MQKMKMPRHCGWLAMLALGTLLAPAAYGNSCLTQAQMTAAQRSYLMNVAETLVSQVQTGDVNGLKTNTLASVAANFTGIYNSAMTLRPDIQGAGITVDALFGFDTGTGQQTAASQFFCSPNGSAMTMVLNFSALPPGKYALAILHATGVPKPQQISLILAMNEQQQWKLAGFSSKPLLLNGKDGVWYWSEARHYSQRKMDWAAWFYYQIAEYLVEPASFLSSPNSERLTKEAAGVRPANLPDSKPVMVERSGETFAISRVNTSDQLGSLDFVVYYTPNAGQEAELRDPAQARKQVVDLMAAMLALHPGLKTAFHGVWVFAATGNVTHFSLELPMNQIPGGLAPNTATYPGAAGQ
jgi:hypothetical protein